MVVEWWSMPTICEYSCSVEGHPWQLLWPNWELLINTGAQFATSDNRKNSSYRSVYNIWPIVYIHRRGLTNAYAESIVPPQLGDHATYWNLRVWNMELVLLVRALRGDTFKAEVAWQTGGQCHHHVFSCAHLWLWNRKEFVHMGLWIQIRADLEMLYELGVTSRSQAGLLVAIAPG